MDTYFALLPTNQIGSALVQKKDEYYRYLENCGRQSLLQLAYETYFKSDIIGGRLFSTGNEGEYVNISVNHYRNLLQHRLIMTTSQRPAFEPKAINTDSESMAQVALASGLLEYYERTKKMERFLTRATELAINYGEGFVGVSWDATAGNPYIQDEQGRLVNDGDLQFNVYNTFQVIRSPEIKQHTKQNWYMLVGNENKFEMAAKYPNLKDAITGYQKTDTDYRYRFTFEDYRKEQVQDPEQIPVYVFMHRRTDAVPNGRIVVFTDADLVYIDGPLPYKDIPLYRIAPGEQDGLPFGYTVAFDMLPMQEALDKLESTIITNQAAFGVQNVWVPNGSGANVINLRGGLNLITGDPQAGPPQPINLTSTPREIFQKVDDIKRDMETLSGVNSVVRGNPEKNLESGSALALVQSMAIQFAQGLQLSYAELLEDVGTCTIEILQDYANTERVAFIVGKANRSNLKSFKGSDLKNICRVIVDMGNPLMRTTAGRVNLAEQLIQNQMIKTPQQYIEVLTTGRVEPIYEGERAELQLIRSENEELQNGGHPSAIIIDDHELHIQEHKVVLSSPEARRNPVIVQAVLGHIQEHIMLQQPLPPATMTQPPQGPGNIENPGAVPEAVDATTPVSQQAQSVNMPNQPVNPLTGKSNTPT